MRPAASLSARSRSAASASSIDAVRSWIFCSVPRSSSAMRCCASAGRGALGLGRGHLAQLAERLLAALLLGGENHLTRQGEGDGHLGDLGADSLELLLDGLRRSGDGLDVGVQLGFNLGLGGGRVAGARLKRFFHPCRQTLATKKLPVEKPLQTIDPAAALQGGRPQILHFDHIFTAKQITAVSGAEGGSQGLGRVY